MEFEFKGLQQEWDSGAGKRSTIEDRWEDYSRWTLPWIFPEKGNTETDELTVARGSIGARCVNHLANKLVQTLFLPYRPFFKLTIAREALDKLRNSTNKSEQELLAQLDIRLAEAEKEAHAELNVAVHRTQSVLAMKYVVVLGNTLLYYPEDNIGVVEVYSPKNYQVKRDLSGKVIRILTHDTKQYSSFSKDVQDKLAMDKSKSYKADTDVHLYTLIKWDAATSKYVVSQDADHVKLDTKGSYPADKLPWIPLTWNLVRGEDYGRGLVEDYAYAFHSHAILTEAYDLFTSFQAHIVGLVKPGAFTSAEEFNNTPSGRYLSGEEGDITFPDSGRSMDQASLALRIQELERELGQAFLLNSAVTRDAERVTKEEIIRQAQELEVSHGGIYSRLAAEWQVRLALLLLDGINYDIGTDFKPVITTGMDTLSRVGDLESIELWFNDLAALNNLPDEARMEMHMGRTMRILGAQRNVSYEKMLKSDEEKQAEQEELMARQQAALDAEAQAKGEANAAGELAKNI